MYVRPNGDAPGISRYPRQDAEVAHSSPKEGTDR